MRTLDLVGLAFVFVLIAIVGYVSTKKVKSADDFILADRKLTKLQAALSLAASDFGGAGLVGASAYVYSVGIAGALYNWSAVPALLILGYVIAKKVRRLKITTVPQFLGERFSPKLRLFTSALHILGLATMIAAQFLVASIALNVILGIPQNIALIVSLVVVLLYTAGGGLIAVVNTDVLQFVLIIASVLIALPLSINKIGSFSTLLSSIPKQFLDIGNIGFWEPFSWVLLCFFLYGTNQAYLQRAFAAKDESTSAFSFYFTGIAYIFYGLLVGLIGLAIYVLLPNLSDPNLGFALLIKDVIPVGLSGIALGGLFAATMSTADSYLLGATSLFINDIYKPYINKDATDKQVLKASRISTILIAAIGILVSTMFDNLISIIMLGGLLYSAVVFFPFIFGLFSKKISSKTAMIAVIASFIVGLISEFYLKGNFEGFLGLPSNILVSGTSLIIILVLTYVIPSKST